MIVYDDRLEMDIEGFKALLRSRNERLGTTENYHGRIEFDADTKIYIICSVYMPDGVLGGWIAAEKISSNTYHVQVYYLTDLWADCSQYLRQLAWFIIEAYKGRAIADKYSENIYYVKVHDVVQILPFDDLSLSILNQEQITNHIRHIWIRLDPWLGMLKIRRKAFQSRQVMKLSQQTAVLDQFTYKGDI